MAEVVRSVAEKRRIVALNAAALTVVGITAPPNTGPDIIARAKLFEAYLKGDDDGT